MEIRIIPIFNFQFFIDIFANLGIING
jgi:hypothetical protein